MNENDKVSDFEAFLDLVNVLFLYRNFKNKKIVNLYRLLGWEKFMALIQFADGETFKFPTINQWKDFSRTAIVYFWTEIRKVPWRDLSSFLPFKADYYEYYAKIERLREMLRSGGNKGGFYE